MPRFLESRSLGEKGFYHLIQLLMEQDEGKHFLAALSPSFSLSRSSRGEVNLPSQHPFTAERAKHDEKVFFLPSL